MWKRYLRLICRRANREIKSRLNSKREIIKGILGFFIGVLLGIWWLGGEAVKEEVVTTLTFGLAAACIVWLGEALFDYARAPYLLYKNSELKRKGLQNKYRALKNSLKPKVEILFENKPPFAEFHHYGPSRESLYYKSFHIAVKNISGTAAFGLRVEFSGRCRDRVLDNLPLILRGYPSNISQFDLSSSPENLKRIYVVMRQESKPTGDAKRSSVSRPITIMHQQGADRHREMLCETEQHEITITVYGHNSEPCSKKFLIYIDEHDQLQMELSGVNQTKS